MYDDPGTLRGGFRFDDRLLQRLRVRVRGVRPNRVWVRDSELVVWQARMARDERVVKHWRLLQGLVGLMTREETVLVKVGGLRCEC
jgi:hypothetical protein